MLWVGTHRYTVHGPCSRLFNTHVPMFFDRSARELLPFAFKVVLGLRCSLTERTVWPAHFSGASAALVSWPSTTCISDIRVAFVAYIRPVAVLLLTSGVASVCWEHW